MGQLILPSFYTIVPESEAHEQANASSVRPPDRNSDRLPFNSLGGRRFEILAYLLLLRKYSDPKHVVTLVKASGDQGRDVLVHESGQLLKVVQCKNLDDQFTRPALLKELVKLALFDKTERFIPVAGCDYELWVPSGLTGPADEIIANWPNKISENEIREAFLFCTKSYKGLSALMWDDCAGQLRTEFPKRIRLIKYDGLRLSDELRRIPELHARFFEATIVMRKDDLEGLLQQKIQPLADIVQGLTQSNRPAPRTVVHSLVLPTADFVGRRSELEELRNAIITGSRIAILSGEGGVGKTAIARVLAAELAHLYPDGRLEVDLLGMSSGPLSPIAVMSKIIRSFDVRATLPEEDDEVAGLFRSILRERKVLLLLDNASAREQVEPLCQSIQGLVVITSRNHFYIPGSSLIRLSRFPRSDSLSLIRKICQAINEGDAQSIAERCCDIPLALRIVASALRVQDDLPASDIIAQLRTDIGRQEILEPVKWAIELSLAALDRPLSAFWCRLGVFGGGFDSIGAAMLGPIPSEDAAKALRTLRQRNLLEWDEKTKEYSMHDIARDLACKSLGDRELFGAQIMHMRYLAEPLVKAMDLTDLGAENTFEALRLFDKHWDDIRSLRNWALSMCERDKAAATIAWVLSDVYDRFAAIRLRAVEYVAWCEGALKAARLSDNRDVTTQRLLALGAAYAQIRDKERAQQCFEEALARSRADRDQQGEVLALSHLGGLLFVSGSLVQALAALESSLNLAREMGSRQLEEYISGTLWKVRFFCGKVKESLELLSQHEKWAFEQKDPRNIATLYLDVARTLLHLGPPLLGEPSVSDVHSAINCLAKAISISRAIGDSALVASAIWCAGVAHVFLGKPEGCEAWMVAYIDYAKQNDPAAVERLSKEMEEWLRMAHARSRRATKTVTGKQAQRSRGSAKPPLKSGRKRK